MGLIFFENPEFLALKQNYSNYYHLLRTYMADTISVYYVSESSQRSLEVGVISIPFY